MSERARRPFRLGGEALIVLVFLAVTLLYLAETFAFRRTMMSDYVGPALFPQILSVLGLALVALYFLRPRSVDGNEAEDGVQARSWREEVGNLLPLLPVLGYVLILEGLGFLPSTLLYIIITMRMFGLPWGKSAVYSVGLTLLFFILFYYVLLTELPMGRWIDTEEMFPFIENLRRAIELR